MGEQTPEDTENGTPPALADYNHYDYGFRIYNPRIGKFLSVDPLNKSYPMWTPYQFASNTPIQAIDLDGLEYVHFGVQLDIDGTTVLKTWVIEDFRNMDQNQIHNQFGVDASEFYQRNSQSYGPAGEGAMFSYYLLDNNCNLIKQGSSVMEQEQNTIYSSIITHGFYYGYGSVTKNGPNFSVKDGKNKYNFTIKPIDQVDAIARLHDMEMSVKDFKDYSELRWGSADVRLVNRLKEYLKNSQDPDYTDPFTGRKPSHEAVQAAMNAITIFEGVIESKLEMIARGSNNSKVKTDENETNVPEGDL